MTKNIANIGEIQNTNNIPYQMDELSYLYLYKRES